MEGVMRELEIWDDVTALLRSSLAGCCKDDMNLHDMDGMQWENIFTLSYPHHLTALLYDSIRKLPQDAGLSSATLLKFAVVTDKIEREYLHKQQVVTELAHFYRQHSITVMLLKGFGISEYNPVPCHRSISDIDIFLYGATEKADRLLEQELNIKICNDVHHHNTFMYKGVLVENHYDFINTHDHRSAKQLDAVFKRLAAGPGRAIEIGGESVVLPSANFNALFLMRHMAAHYAAERISIRHLCDWMMFLNREHTHIDFKQVELFYRQFNLYKFADAVNGILIDRLGLDAAMLPPFERNHELENRIFNDIVSPEFQIKRPAAGTMRIVVWKIRRFIANRWKHKIIYSEPWLVTFFQSFISHLIKPGTIKG